MPNLKGLESAIECGVKEIAVFSAASETFTQKNTNCGIQESISRFTQLSEVALKNNIKIRGYISCVMGCPYEGEIEVSQVNRVAESLLDLGCYEISLGDTIGAGNIHKSRDLMEGIYLYLL